MSVSVAAMPPGTEKGSKSRPNRTLHRRSDKRRDALPNASNSSKPSPPNIEIRKDAPLPDVKDEKVSPKEPPSKNTAADRLRHEFVPRLQDSTINAVTRHLTTPKARERAPQEKSTEPAPAPNNSKRQHQRPPKHTTQPPPPPSLAQSTGVMEELVRTKQQLAQQLQEVEHLRRKLDELQQQHAIHTKTLDEVRGSLQCPVCLDLMQKPHVISPCGHVCCQDCLEKWFFPSGYQRTARKTCPSCRTQVHTQPLPLFLAKDLIRIIDDTVDKPYEAGPSAVPWDKVFSEKRPQSIHWEPFPYFNQSQRSRESRPSGVCRLCGLAYDIGHCTRTMCTQRFGSASSNGSDHGDASAAHTSYEHVYPSWGPPLFIVDPREVDNLNQLQLLRRGATPAMIRQYNMTYNHDQGICAVVENRYGMVGQVYLGWNIHVEPRDRDGRQFMRTVLDEMRSQPELFAIEECDEGPWIAWMLVPQDQVVDFNLTDTEMLQMEMEMNP